MTSTGVNTMARVLNADAQRFSTECHDRWTKEVDQGGGRIGYPAEGPGASLGMDVLLQLEFERLAEMGGLPPGHFTVIDRESFEERLLRYA